MSVLDSWRLTWGCLTSMQLAVHARGQSAVQRLEERVTCHGLLARHPTFINSWSPALLAAVHRAFC